MRKIKSQLGSPVMHQHKMLLLKDCPPAPEGFHWTKQGDTSDWCYMRHDKVHDLHFWAVRDTKGRVCMGLINHAGYIVEAGDDTATMVTTIMTKKKLGIEAMLT